MKRIEVAGMIYEFEDELPLMELLDERADHVYEGTTMERTPPNDPLTLEELREMDGEPVWCVNGYGGQWCLVRSYLARSAEYVECTTSDGFAMEEALYGGMGMYAWLAYRRKLEEGTCPAF